MKCEVVLCLRQSKVSTPPSCTKKMGRKQIFRVLVSQVLFLGDELSQMGTDMQVVEDARRPFVSSK